MKTLGFITLTALGVVLLSLGSARVASAGSVTGTVKFHTDPGLPFTIEVDATFDGGTFVLSRGSKFYLASTYLGTVVPGDPPYVLGLITDASDPSYLGLAFFLHVFDNGPKGDEILFEMYDYFGGLIFTYSGPVHGDLVVTP